MGSLAAVFVLVMTGGALGPITSFYEFQFPELIYRYCGRIAPPPRKKRMVEVEARSNPELRAQLNPFLLGSATRTFVVFLDRGSFN